MKQPHIYTLPERFIKDPSVPLRWKLYTIINGFWISGKPVFASNEFFAEKLGCSDRHVRECLAELEEMYLITRHGSSQKRRIIPGGHGVPPNDEGRSPELRGGGTGSSAGEEPRAPHIADSIADNLTGEQGSQDYEIVKDKETETSRPDRKDTSYLSVFALWGAGYPLNWRGNRTEIQSAKNILIEHDIEKAKVALEFYNENKGESWCPTIFSPTDLDRKWVKLQNFRDKLDKQND